MTILGHQFGIAPEVSYGTAVTVDRFYEYKSNPAPIKPLAGRTVSEGLRVGRRHALNTRAVPFANGAEGTIELDVLTDTFGLLLAHCLGSVSTTGSGPYTHTVTSGTADQLYALSLTAQLNYMFRNGTNQAFTFSGGKVRSWEIANSVDDLLTLSADMWFSSHTTGTALATADYTDADAALPYTWAHGAVTIGGTSVDVTSISVSGDNGQKTGDDAKRLGNTWATPTSGPAETTFSIECDWTSLAHYNRVHSATAAGMYAEIEGVWTNGTDSFTLTIPAGLFNDVDLAGDPGQPMQTLTGIATDNGSDPVVTIEYVSSDADA